MIGYVIHLHTEWHGLRHMLIAAPTEFAALCDFAASAPAKHCDNLHHSRIGAVLTQPEHWELFESQTLKQLCKCCTPR